MVAQPIAATADPLGLSGEIVVLGRGGFPAERPDLLADGLDIQRVDLVDELLPQLAKRPSDQLRHRPCEPVQQLALRMPVEAAEIPVLMELNGGGAALAFASPGAHTAPPQ